MNHVFLTLALAATTSTAAQETIDFLPLDQEAALALSAAPEHLRPDATVYALTPDGFVVTQEGTNGFTCVVNRDHPRNRKPTCYDAVGSAAVLPKELYQSEMMLAGLSQAAIEDSIQAGFASGRFVAPAGPGVAYMLSPGIRTYNANTGQYGTFPPHVMFYAPNLTNEDIATDWNARAANPWLPFVAYQGPHGFLVMVVP